MATTTAFCTSQKSDMMSALTCFNQQISPTVTTTTGAFTLTAVSALTGLAVGMSVIGTGIPASSVIASIDSSTQITISKAATASATITATFNGDIFNISLIKVTPAGTYGAGSTNYTDITGNTDEVTGTGYTAGGVAMSNVSPTTSGTTAFMTFSPNPSWTSATFSTTAGMIYNTSRRGPLSTRAVSTHDFGGTQTVSSGTLTLVMPTAAAATAIIRLA
jgi:hypothetical protein